MCFKAPCILVINTDCLFDCETTYKAVWKLTEGKLTTQKIGKTKFTPLVEQKKVVCTKVEWVSVNYTLVKQNHVKNTLIWKAHTINAHLKIDFKSVDQTINRYRRIEHMQVHHTKSLVYKK